jgi:phosphoribosylformylglycinamidine synthase I
MMDIKMKKATVIVFPGSNCDKEAKNILEKFGFQTTCVWHEENLPNDTSVCFLPGGFSYGDYLRSGAVAGRSRIMNDVRNFAEKGGITIGVCNGFQILTEAKILPGALLPNANGNFVCKEVSLKRKNKTSIFTQNLKDDLNVQVAHGDGMFTADEKTLKMLQEEDRIAFTYKQNFNGSKLDIAGIIGGKNYNILGMMPHPERTIVSEDFIDMFQNIKNHAERS